MNDLTVLTVDDHCAAEKIIIAYKEGRLPEGDCKSLLDQLVAHGAAEERESNLAAIKAEYLKEHNAEICRQGPECSDCGYESGLDDAIRAIQNAARIRQRGEK